MVIVPLQLSVRVTCEACGVAIALAGPFGDVPCAACGHTQEVPLPMLATVWPRALAVRPREDRALAGTLWGRANLSFKVERRAVRCTACDAVLPVEDVDARSSTLACKGCGSHVPVWPSPSALHADADELEANGAPISMQAWRVVGPLPGSSVPSTARVVRPVVYACPRCGKGLELTTGTPRVTACGPCGADVFVPDALWRHLHPEPPPISFSILIRQQVAGEVEDDDEVTPVAPLASPRSRRPRTPRAPGSLQAELKGTALAEADHAYENAHTEYKKASAPIDPKALLDVPPVKASGAEAPERTVPSVPPAIASSARPPLASRDAPPVSPRGAPTGPPRRGRPASAESDAAVFGAATALEDPDDAAIFGAATAFESGQPTPNRPMVQPELRPVRSVVPRSSPPPRILEEAHDGRWTTTQGVVAVGLGLAVGAALASLVMILTG